MSAGMTSLNTSLFVDLTWKQTAMAGDETVFRRLHWDLRHERRWCL